MKTNYSFLREKVPSENYQKMVQGIDELNFSIPAILISTFKFISKNHYNGSRTILTMLPNLGQRVITAHIHWRDRNTALPAIQ